MKDPLELLIFDCDGVLVDSELIACDIVAQVLASLGFPVTCADIVAQFTGVADREMYAQLERQAGRAVPQEARQRVASETLRAFAERLQPVEGVREALDAIPHPKSVASGSEMQRVRLSLSCTGLLHHFEPHVYTREQVPRGKPAPDLFLHAARQRGVPPSRCAVIEDSVAGVRAGEAAGMYVLGFVGASHSGQDLRPSLLAAGAAVVFDAMHQLPRLIAEADGERPQIIPDRQTRREGRW